ncbi:hypothetical protein B0H12DRAFT_193086 [Mycena haematopus]|nr:hypothetical protein B0H12DRAFT_193086 [Mycena haematopus]
MYIYDYVYVTCTLLCAPPISVPPASISCTCVFWSRFWFSCFGISALDWTGLDLPAPPPHLCIVISSYLSIYPYRRHTCFLVLFSLRTSYSAPLLHYYIYANDCLPDTHTTPLIHTYVRYLFCLLVCLVWMGWDVLGMGMGLDGGLEEIGWYSYCDCSTERERMNVCKIHCILCPSV